MAPTVEGVGAYWHVGGWGECLDKGPSWKGKRPGVLGGVRAPAQLRDLSLLTSPLCALRSTKGLDHPRLFLALPDLGEPRERTKRPETRKCFV